jgi:hypothetical protein
MTTRLMIAHATRLAAFVAAGLTLWATSDHALAGSCGFHHPCIKIIPPSTGCYGWGKNCRNPVKRESNASKANAPALVGKPASRRR